MARRTIERWLADVWPTPKTLYKANIADRKRDQKAGAQMRGALDKDPATDWRTLMKQKEQG